MLEPYGADLHEALVNEHTGEPMNALSTTMDWGNDDVVEYLRSMGCMLPASPPTSSSPQSLGDEVVAYFAEHFGPVHPHSVIEIVPTEPAIAVRFIPAEDERNCVALFTTGMSARPMRAPDGEQDYARAELFVQLPRDWRFRELADPNWAWPLQCLRWIAQHPHAEGTCLGPAAVFANGDPPQLLAPNVQFTALLLAAERSFAARVGERVQFYRMTPLYADEHLLLQRQGIGALIRAFDRHSIPLIVNPQRPSVTTPR